ncbi:MAG: transport system permease protein [Holophagaceae bacterium]|nr:transport system permease protein [Holophagaceae bacterium]
MNKIGLLPSGGHPCLHRLWGLAWVLLPILVLFIFALELCLGSISIPPGKVFSILLGDGQAPEAWRNIILLFRLPRAITATLAGAALGMAGLQMQTLFRNPLADPFVLGINSGASLGVALVVMSAGAVGWTASVAQVAGAGFSLIVASSLGSMAVMSLILVVARKVESSLTLLIVGIMAGYLASSIVTILMHFSQEQQLQRYIGWTFGSFGGVTWSHLRIFAPAVLFSGLLAWSQAKAMNALLLGEGYARSMGLAVRRSRFLLILSSSVLAGSVTAYCGPIGFLGIAVPHLARMLMRTTDHHVLAPTVLLMGAGLALAADLIAQAPGTSTALPLNAITSLLGAPFVLGVVLRRRQVLEAGA